MMQKNDKITLTIAVAIILVMLVSFGCSSDTSGRDKDSIQVFLHQSMNSWNEMDDHATFAMKRVRLDSDMAADGTLNTKKYHEAVDEESTALYNDMEKYSRIQLPTVTYRKGDYKDVTDLIVDANRAIGNAMHEEAKLANLVYQVDEYKRTVAEINKNLDAYDVALTKLNKIYGFKIMDECKRRK